MINMGPLIEDFMEELSIASKFFIDPTSSFFIGNLMLGLFSFRGVSTYDIYDPA